MKFPADHPATGLPIGLEFDDEESLGLVPFGDARAFYRSRVEDRRRQGFAPKIPGQDLVAVDVTRENRREAFGDPVPGNDVCARSEHEVRGPDGGALDGLVETEQAEIMVAGRPARFRKERTEPVADSFSFARKTGETDAAAGDLDLDDSGAIEDVEMRMGG